jgi:pyruvyltransferase
MDNILVRWSGNHLPNWGDELNKTLIKKITGKDIVWHPKQTEDHYICIGSILQWSNEKTTVWGAGFIGSDRRLAVKPKNICAVRGPLSRDIIISQGYECPEVYGDPALLYPRYYNPNKSKKYKYGIIPHYIDAAHPWVQKFINNPDVKIINIIDPTINRFVDEINECEIILSSSLHGLIAADSYGVPSYWIELSDKVIGNGFKFHDYFASVNRPIVKPFKPTENTKISNLPLYDYSVDIDLDKLINSCPFKK